MPLHFYNDHHHFQKRTTVKTVQVEHQLTLRFNKPANTVALACQSPVF